MYPEAFINWIGENGYFRSGGAWWTWPDYEKMEVWIADNVDELFKIWEEQNKKTEG